VDFFRPFAFFVGFAFLAFGFAFLAAAFLLGLAFTRAPAFTVGFFAFPFGFATGTAGATGANTAGGANGSGNGLDGRCSNTNGAADGVGSMRAPEWGTTPPATFPAHPAPVNNIRPPTRP
jgi:hypothetical protein